MIRKFFYNISLILVFSLIIILVLLSTVGIETNRFNKLITDKINQTKNIKLELKTINFKLDPKELSLFLETQQPTINYNELYIPGESIRVYIDFLSLLKADLKIRKINLALKEIDINQLKKLSKFIKPSNFKNFLSNNVLEGDLISEIEFFFNNQGVVKNYIIKGDVKNLEANISNELNLTKTNLSFFADREDILIKNIFGNIKDIKITEGDIKLNLVNGIKLNSDFNTEINFDIENLKIYNKFLKKYNIEGKIKLLNGNFINNLSIDLDNTYKLKNYSYKSSGKIRFSKFELPYTLKNSLITDEIKEIYLKDTQIDINLSSKNFKLNSLGKYSINNLEFLKFNLENIFSEKILNLNANFDYRNRINLSFINYLKPEKTSANISLKIKKKENLINIKSLILSEKQNKIKISDLIFKNKNFLSLKKIEVETLNNNFFIEWDKKVTIKGSKFDARNLYKFLNEQGDNNKMKNIDKNIEINFTTIKIPLSEELQNFRLIGEIQKGKFVKISSKGDFGGNNFLDISMKKDKNGNKRYLEVYSDLPQPFLANYNFFKGLSGGNLLYTSLIDGEKSNSKLKIENFRVANAPGVIKLLSLADLGGLADLVDGEGLSFDKLEIDMEKNKKFLKINEILALGPSMSVLMEGYQDATGLTSLKGTLVPAKTLNKIISKIPVIGNIVIPKDVGEGLFGISFKMKGPEGNIKTTINPIRTLTPRFIQKIVERNKEAK